MNQGAARPFATSRTVRLALLAAVALRLVFALGYWVGKPLTHDEQEYLELGRNVAAGRGFTYDAGTGDTTERFGRAPLYPLVVAAVSLAASPATLPTAVRVVQSLVGAVTVLLLVMVVRRLADVRAAATTAWLVACYPPLIWISAYILSESVYTALAWGNVLLLMPALDAPRAGGAPGNDGAGRLLAGGIVGGLAALTRPAHVFFLLLVGAWLLARRRVAAVALVAAGALLVIGPWTIRNYVVYERVVLIASEGGITFWTGNHPLSSGEGDMAANPAVKQDNDRFRRAHAGLSPEELEPLYYREAFGRIAKDPVWWLGLEARKLLYLWVPVGPSYTLHSRLYRVTSWVSYGLLLPLGATGLLRLWRLRARPVTLGLLLASAVLACLVFLPQERFRLPVIDPALVIGAGILNRRPE